MSLLTHGVGLLLAGLVLTQLDAVFYKYDRYRHMLGLPRSRISVENASSVVGCAQSKTDDLMKRPINTAGGP